jgi:hypothetical protein
MSGSRVCPAEGARADGQPVGGRSEPTAVRAILNHGDEARVAEHSSAAGRCSAHGETRGDITHRGPHDPQFAIVGGRRGEKAQQAWRQAGGPSPRRTTRSVVSTSASAQRGTRMHDLNRNTGMRPGPSDDPYRWAMPSASDRPIRRRCDPPDQPPRDTVSAPRHCIGRTMKQQRGNRV